MALRWVLCMPPPVLAQGTRAGRAGGRRRTAGGAVSGKRLRGQARATTRPYHPPLHLSIAPAITYNTHTSSSSSLLGLGEGGRGGAPPSSLGGVVCRAGRGQGG